MWNLRPEVKRWKRKFYGYETPLKEKSQGKSVFGITFSGILGILGTLLTKLN